MEYAHASEADLAIHVRNSTIVNSSVVRMILIVRRGMTNSGERDELRQSDSDENLSSLGDGSTRKALVAVPWTEATIDNIATGKLSETCRKWTSQHIAKDRKGDIEAK